MAFNYQDIDPENMDQQQLSDEERKKRLAMLANLATGGTFSGAMEQFATKKLDETQNRINQAGEMIQNPEQALQQRMGVQQPVQQTGPVMPPEVERERQIQQLNQPQVQQPVQQVAQPSPVMPVQPKFDMGEFAGVDQAIKQQQATQPTQPQAPVAPETAVITPAAQQQLATGQQQPVSPEQLAQTQLPQAGPSVQVAGPAQLPVQQPTQEELHQQQVIAARNETDPQKRRQMFASLLANENVSEGNKAMANRFIAEDYLKGRKMAEAEEKIAKATPNDLARYMNERKEEGSYMKAILFKRLGLTELAQQEQEKISPTLKFESATDANGNKYTVERNNQGQITRAFNASGQTASQEEVARLSAAAMPTKAHLLPSVHGSPVQRTNAKGEVETGLMMYDPQSNTSYVQVGNTRLPTTGWTTMSQTPQSVAAAAGARVTGEAGAKGFDVTQPGTTGNVASLAQSLGAKVIGGARTPETQAALYQQSVDAGTPGVLPNGNPVAKPGTSKHETGNAVDIDSATLTPDQRKALAMNGFRQPLPKTDPNHWEYDPSTANKKSPLYKQEMQAKIDEARIKEEQKPVAEAKGKEGAAVIKKQAFADNAYPIVKELGNIIKESTGSGIGAGVDDLAALIGKSPKGAQAIAKLETFASPLVSMVPRFEGSQSDRDVQMYQKQAGDFANPKLPVATRLAALQGMVKLLQIYDKEGVNDWSFGEAKKSPIKIISREKVQ